MPGMKTMLVKAENKKDFEKITHIWNQNKKEMTDDGRTVTSQELEGFLKYGFSFYLLEGYAFACVKIERGTMTLAHFAVDCKKRGKGIGKKICKLIEKKALEENCQKLKSSTRADNFISQIVLLKAGFRPARINYHQFIDSADEIEYEKYLK